MTAKDVLLLSEMQARCGEARLDLLGDPEAFISLTLSGPAPNMRHYWALLRDLRVKVRAAAGMHWMLIEESAEWKAIGDLAKRWTRAQYGLFRLFVGGVARCCHLVDVIDAADALETIHRL